MSVKFKVAKGSGETICNVIRQTALTQLYAVKPIAFKMGVGSTILSAGDSVYEDMIEFMSSLLAISFDLEGGVTEKDYNKIIEVTYECSGTFTVNDLQKDRIQVTSVKNAYDEILHTVQTEQGDYAKVQFTIYYRIGCGCATREQNEFYLAEQYSNNNSLTHSTLDDGLNIMSSRYSDISGITYNIDDNALNADIIEMQIDSSNSASTKDIIVTVLKQIQTTISDIEHQI